MDPDTAAARALGEEPTNDPSGNVADNTGESAGSGRSISITEMLLATDPPQSPAAYDQPDEVAHLIIAAKKMLNKLIDGDMGSGETAAENLLQAAVGFVRRREKGESGDSPAPGNKDV
jgi:hypothetical protein